MKILAIEKPAGTHSSTDFTPHLKAEAEKVLELYERGSIREMYFDLNHCAVLVLECSDAAEASAVLGTLPLVQHSLIHFEVTALTPYTGFSRLVNREEA